MMPVTLIARWMDKEDSQWENIPTSYLIVLPLMYQILPPTPYMRLLKGEYAYDNALLQ